MGFKRKMRRKDQMAEIRNSYCRKCHIRLSTKNGVVICEKCGRTYGKVSDRG